MILLVANNNNEIAVMLEMLRSQFPDIEVRLARTCNDALDTIGYARPPASLVMVDQRPGETEAFELLARIRRTPHIRHTPVVMLSDPADTAGIGTSYNLGANSCLDKCAWLAQDTAAISQAARYWLQVNHCCTRARDGAL